MSDSLKPHELQHTRLPWPSISLWVCSDSCPLSQWCHLTILSSVTLFSSCPPSFSALVQFSRSVISDSLRPHELQHARLLCPSLSPRICSDSCPLSQWCHPTVLCSVIPFSCLQSFPASGSFPVSQFFESGGQRIGVSASASVLPIEYSGLISFRMDWFDLLAV